MNKHLKGAVILVFVSFVLMTSVFLIIVVMIRGQSIAQFFSSGFTTCKAEAAMKKASDSLKNTATFKYDGLGESVKLVKIEAGGQEGTWTVVYLFQTRHPGHGNRSKQALAQVITAHTAELNLKDCKVVSAVCDNDWDLLSDKSVN